jgi:nucleoside-diphosphate-sugar epimerase
MKQKNNKIFITGATGKIGKVLLKKLLSKGYQVKALVRDPKKLKSSKDLEVIVGDIGDKNIIDNALIDCDYLIHLAAYQNANNENKDEFFRVNVKGTKILLDLAKRRKIKKFLYISTVMVFEKTGRIPRNENWNLNLSEKDNLYVVSKVKALRIVNRYKDDIPLVILYPTVVTDPRDFSSNSSTKMKGWQKLLYKSVGGGIPGGLMSLIGDKNRIINIIYIEDLVDLIVGALEKGKVGNDYILGGRNVSVDEYLDEMCRLKKIKKFPFRIPLFLFKFLAFFRLPMFKIVQTIAKSPPCDLCFDSTKARKELV